MRERFPASNRSDSKPAAGLERRLKPTAVAGLKAMRASERTQRCGSNDGTALKRSNAIACDTVRGQGYSKRKYQRTDVSDDSCRLQDRHSCVEPGSVNSRPGASRCRLGKLSLCVVRCAFQISMTPDRVNHSDARAPGVHEMETPSAWPTPKVNPAASSPMITCLNDENSALRPLKSDVKTPMEAKAKALRTMH
jgi:hypothetical protein